MSRNIASAFVESALREGDKDAIIEASTGARIGFADMNRRSDAYAHYLSEQGIGPGDVVMLMVRPSIDFICLSLSLFKIGAPIVLIDPGMGYRNLLKCISSVRPKYLIGIPQAVLFSRLFAKSFSSIEARFCCGCGFGLLGPDIRKKITLSEKSFPVYQPREDDLAAIIFTTGSTGPPKGVRYEHSIFHAQLKLIDEYYSINSGDIDQPAFPLFGLFAAALGARAVIPDMDPTRPAKVDPEKFVKSLHENNVTYSFGSPAIWNVVSRYCCDHHITIPSLKKVLMAGAPVPPELLIRMKKILSDDAEIHTPYGATESLPIVNIEAREIIGETAQASLKGAGTCVGRSLPGIDVKIMKMSDSEIGHFSEELLLPEGEIGEIIVKGPVVTKAYQNNPQETLKAKMYDGDTIWHRMGDVGYLDEKGRLWFCGRKAHRVETSQRIFFSIPCEAIVNCHPDVYRSALVGVQGKNGLEPVLIVEPVKDGKSIDRDKLLSEVREYAAASPLTKGVRRFLVHPDFPVDIRHNAKIFREKLAVWAAKQ